MMMTATAIMSIESTSATIPSTVEMARKAIPTTVPSTFESSA